MNFRQSTSPNYIQVSINFHIASRFPHKASSLFGSALIYTTFVFYHQLILMHLLFMNFYLWTAIMYIPMATHIIGVWHTWKHLNPFSSYAMAQVVLSRSFAIRSSAFNYHQALWQYWLLIEHILYSIQWGPKSLRRMGKFAYKKRMQVLHDILTKCCSVDCVVREANLIRSTLFSSCHVHHTLGSASVSVHLGSTNIQSQAAMLVANVCEDA